VVEELAPQRCQRHVWLVIARMTCHKSTVASLLPHGQARTRRSPRVEDLSVGSRVGTDKFEKVEDEGFDRVGHSPSRKTLAWDRTQPSYPVCFSQERESNDLCSVRSSRVPLLHHIVHQGSIEELDVRPDLSVAHCKDMAVGVVVGSSAVDFPLPERRPCPLLRCDSVHVLYLSILLLGTVTVFWTFWSFRGRRHMFLGFGA